MPRWSTATHTPRASYRLEPEVREMIARLAGELGVSQSDVVRIAVREMAARRAAVR
jgi:hypothetical protein